MQTRNGAVALNDNMFGRIVQAEQALKAEAARRGLGGSLHRGGDFAVRSIDRNLEGCTVSVGFNPGLGCSYELSTIVTDADQIVPLGLAAQFIDWMEAIRDRNAEVAASRRAIRAITERAIRQAERQGSYIELLRIEVAPIAVYGAAADAHDFRHPQTLQVCLIMNQVIDGKIVRDEVVIDANRPEEFAAYLAETVLPEQLEILSL